MWSFVQVLLTPTDLAIVMEYAAGGELFERICNAGRFSEDEVIGTIEQRPKWMEADFVAVNLIVVNLEFDNCVFFSSVANHLES